jgi:formylglycine-generating enzyme required for sulfatase activity
MVRIPAPGGTSYCIDTTEVTQAQYAAFLASDPHADTSSQYCAYKTTFVPGHEPGDVNNTLEKKVPTQCHPDHDLFDPTGTPLMPVVCVDWCEAVAYCAWAGKRLCGHIGGGPTTEADFADPTTGEWVRACSSAGAETYPYGASYEHGSCNDGTTVANVASFPDCHGQGAPFERIFDMSGNVFEWDSLCRDGLVMDPGPDGGPSLPICMLRGGTIGSDKQDLACNGLGGMGGDDMNLSRPWTGIRCCAD